MPCATTLPVFQFHNSVAAPHGSAQSVGDEQDGEVAIKPLDGVHHRLFGGVVEGAGGFARTLGRWPACRERAQMPMRCRWPPERRMPRSPTRALGSAAGLTFNEVRDLCLTCRLPHPIQINSVSAVHRRRCSQPEWSRPGRCSVARGRQLRCQALRRMSLIGLTIPPGARPRWVSVIPSTGPAWCSCHCRCCRRKPTRAPFRYGQVEAVQHPGCRRWCSGKRMASSKRMASWKEQRRGSGLQQLRRQGLLEQFDSISQ